MKLRGTVKSELKAMDYNCRGATLSVPAAWKLTIPEAGDCPLQSYLLTMKSHSDTFEENRQVLTRGA
jgi:hypothetical protein